MNSKNTILSLLAAASSLLFSSCAQSFSQRQSSKSGMTEMHQSTAFNPFAGMIDVNVALFPPQGGGGYRSGGYRPSPECGGDYRQSERRMMPRRPEYQDSGRYENRRPDPRSRYGNNCPPQERRQPGYAQCPPSQYGRDNYCPPPQRRQPPPNYGGGYNGGGYNGQYGGYQPTGRGLYGHSQDNPIRVGGAQFSDDNLSGFVR